MYPSRRHSPQDVCSDDQFQSHDWYISGAHLRYINFKEVPHGAHRCSFGVEHKEIISTKAVTIEVTMSMGVSVHIKHPHIIIKVALTTFQGEMVVVEMEAHIVPSVAMDPTITLLVVDTMVIMVSQVMLLAAPQMIHTVSKSS